MTELELCPFCGGEAKLMHMDLDSIEEGWQVWGVWCMDDLHAEESGGYQHGHCIDNYATADEAIAAWNTRHKRTCHSIDPIDSAEFFICSECGFGKGRIEFVASYNFCPNCGAKVIGGNE